MATSPANEKLDVLVLGATGYTGCLILKYLATHPSRSQNAFTLAAGGRSTARLQTAVENAGFKAGDNVKIVNLDVMDEKSVKDVIKNFRVVVSAVGPFWEHGRVLVRACAELGVHYVDTTGEPHFIRYCIEMCHYTATTTGAIIINAAGFDSVPSDMSAYLGVHALRRLAGPDVQAGKSTSAWVVNGSGLSGGTAATIFQAFSGAVPKWALDRASGLYSLSPMEGPKVSEVALTFRLPFTNIVGGFYPMSNPNSRYVRRTWGLLAARALSASVLPTSKHIPEAETSYGSQFEYTEFLQTKTWLGGLMTSLAIVVGLASLFIAPFRYIAKTFVFPKSGGGPQSKNLEDGYLKITNVTSSVPVEGKPTYAVKTTIRGRGEPGYLLASVSTSEIALSLLPPAFSRLTDLGKEGGVLTSMSAVGMELIDRLKASGRFEFESEPISTTGDEESRKKR